MSAKKPFMILDYNQRKGGVDMFDKNLEEFSCQRKKCGKYYKSKKCFLKNLSFQLAKSAVENRLRLPKQKYRVRDAAVQVGFSIPTESNFTPRPTVSSHQERCRVCKKQTRSRCRPGARIA